MKKTVLDFLLVKAILYGASVGAIYKVGDSVGWTMMGVDYDKWTSTKTFRVGDSLVIEYVSDFHDVNEVIHQNFLLCDVSSSITTDETGSDSINLIKSGHHYYLCGVPGHCEAGQKLDVMVMPASMHTRSPQAVPPVLPPSSSTPSVAFSPHNPVANPPDNVLVKKGVSGSRILMVLNYIEVFVGVLSFFL